MPFQWHKGLLHVNFMSVFEAAERQFLIFLVNCRVREEHLFVRGGARRTAFLSAKGAHKGRP